MLYAMMGENDMLPGREILGYEIEEADEQIEQLKAFHTFASRERANSAILRGRLNVRDWQDEEWFAVYYLIGMTPTLCITEEKRDMLIFLFRQLPASSAFFKGYLEQMFPSLGDACVEAEAHFTRLWPTPNDDSYSEEKLWTVTNARRTATGLLYGPLLAAYWMYKGRREGVTVAELVEFEHESRLALFKIRGPYSETYAGADPYWEPNFLLSSDAPNINDIDAMTARLDPKNCDPQAVLISVEILRGFVAMQLIGAMYSPYRLKYGKTANNAERLAIIGG